MMIERAMLRCVQRRRVAAATLVALAACGPDTPTAPPLADPAQLLYAVVLDHHAITLATSGAQSSIQLGATALSASGATLAGAPVVYSLSDSERVGVDAHGLVTAREAVSGVQLVASVTLGNVTRKDTAYIYAADVSPAPVLTTFTLALASGGTAVPTADLFGFFGFDQALVTAADGNDVPLDGLPAYFTSSDPTTLDVDHSTGAVHAIRPGIVTLRAVTTAYGVTMADSVKITVIDPQLGAVFAGPVTPVGSTTPILVFAPGDLTVSVGASVFFANPSATMPVDIVFDDPTDVAESPFFPMGSGNIAPFSSDTTGGNIGFRFRAFPKAGTYTYHSTLYNSNGRIIVH